MALPASGQLSYSQINVELGNGATSVASMFAMATAAGKSTTNASVSNFYGYSAGDDIIVDFGTTSTPSYTSTYINTYREIVMAGLTAGQTVRPYVTLTTSSASSAGVTFYYSITNTGSVGSWTYITSTSSSGFNSSYYLPTSGTMDSTERMWLRCEISKSSGGYMNGTHTITNTYAGTGSINSYARTSPYTWTWP